MRLPPVLSTDEAGPVRLPLDESSLLGYLLSALPPGTLTQSPQLVGLQQFGHGQSNPTYLVTLAGSSKPGRYSRLQCMNTPINHAFMRPASLVLCVTHGRVHQRMRSCMRGYACRPTRRLVVRKKPPGKILASAHAVEREYAVMRALHGAVPVPVALALCRDEAVLGTPFFVMEHSAGNVFLVGMWSNPGQCMQHVGVHPSVRALPATRRAHASDVVCGATPTAVCVFIVAMQVRGACLDFGKCMPVYDAQFHAYTRLYVPWAARYAAEARHLHLGPFHNTCHAGAPDAPALSAR